MTARPALVQPVGDLFPLPRPEPLVCAFVVLGEPVPCGRARAAPYIAWEGKRPVARVRVHPDPKSDAYQEALGLQALTARPVGWRLDWAAYEVRVRVYQSVARGDWDNFAKAVCDGAQGILWENDRRIRVGRVDMLDDLARPRLEVLASMVGDLDAEADRSARTRLLAAHRRAR